MGKHSVKGILSGEELNVCGRGTKHIAKHSKRDRVFGLMLSEDDFADLGERFERIDKAERQAQREQSNFGPFG